MYGLLSSDSISHVFLFYKIGVHTHECGQKQNRIRLTEVSFDFWSANGKITISFWKIFKWANIGLTLSLLPHFCKFSLSLTLDSLSLFLSPPRATTSPTQLQPNLDPKQRIWNLGGLRNNWMALFARTGDWKVNNSNSSSQWSSPMKPELKLNKCEVD